MLYPTFSLARENIYCWRGNGGQSRRCKVLNNDNNRLYPHSCAEHGSLECFSEEHVGNILLLSLW